MPLKLSLERLLYDRERLRRELESVLPRESVIRATSDYHSRKPPRPCGFTVHSAVGCPFACTYCYLPDMGVNYASARPYGLKGEEMVLALLSNPYFLPGRLGSLIALGSIGEPFADSSTTQKTLEYLAAFSRYLGNPTQFSTKAALGDDVARSLAGIKLPLSPLVTVVTLGRSAALEPGAPSPEVRLEVIRRLRGQGLKPILFLRPLIPGVNTEELDDLLSEAKRHGAIGVVVGGFRATASNLLRLARAGLDLSEVKRRLPKQPAPGEQVSLDLHDLKQDVVRLAREKGLIPFLSACCANNFTAFLYDSLRAPCPGLDFIDGRFCTRCPVDCPSLRTEVDPEEVSRMVRRLTGEGGSVDIDDRLLVIRGVKKRRLKPVHRYLLEVGYRRRVVLK